MALNEKSEDHQIHQDSSSGNHEHQAQNSWQGNPSTSCQDGSLKTKNVNGAMVVDQYQ